MTIIVAPSLSETTLSESRTIIQYKGYGSDTAPAVQNSMINSVYRRVIGKRRWWFYDVVADTSTTTTAGNQRVDLSVPERLLYVNAARIQNGSEYDDLQYLPLQEIREASHLDRDQRRPQYWSIADDELILWPVPDVAYTVVLDYTKRPPELSADTAQVDIPQIFIDVLVWGAIRELCFRERDDTGRAFADSEYREILNDMYQQDNMRQRQNASQVGYSGEVDEVNRYYI